MFLVQEKHNGIVVEQWIIQSKEEAELFVNVRKQSDSYILDPERDWELSSIEFIRTQIIWVVELTEYKKVAALAFSFTEDVTYKTYQTKQAAEEEYIRLEEWISKQTLPHQYSITMREKDVIE